MRKIYIVSEIGWEYNDEKLYRPNIGGVIPKNAFLTKKAAQEVCDKKNLSFLKSINLADYLYGLDELVDPNYYYIIDEMLGKNWEDVYSPDDLPLSDSQWMQLLPYITVKLYEVYDVELEDEDEDLGDFVG